MRLEPAAFQFLQTTLFLTERLGCFPILFNQKKKHFEISKSRWFHTLWLFNVILCPLLIGFALFLVYSVTLLHFQNKGSTAYWIYLVGILFSELATTCLHVAYVWYKHEIKYLCNTTLELIEIIESKTIHTVVTVKNCSCRPTLNHF